MLPAEESFKITTRHVVEDDHDRFRNSDHTQKPHHVGMLELCQHVCFTKKVFADTFCGSLYRDNPIHAQAWPLQYTAPCTPGIVYIQSTDLWAFWLQLCSQLSQEVCSLPVPSSLCVCVCNQFSMATPLPVFGTPVYTHLPNSPFPSCLSCRSILARSTSKGTRDFVCSIS